MPEVTITAPRVDPWDEWSSLLPELEFAPDIDDGKDIYGNSDWEYYIPIWGSSLKANISFQQGLYFDYIGWILWGVAEGLSFGSLSLKGLSAKSTVSTAAKANATKMGTTVFKSFTKSNFRHNLGKLTGRMPSNSQAHHVFPQKFEAIFSSKGINIHDPKFGVWRDTTSHLNNASGYNAAWESFLKTDPTQSQIMSYGQTLMSQYGFAVGF